MPDKTITGIVAPFLGAVQAAVSALLTVAVGVAAAQWGLLDSESSKRISRTCVNIFLPFLLIANLGEELHLDTVQRYIPILIWALLYSVVSLYVGRAAAYIFRLPPWTVPAVAFNNSTSLPLLLLQSLKTAGVLSSLVGEGEYDEAIERARSYFLVCAVVSNTLTFGLGGSELKGFDEDAPDDIGDRVKQLASDTGDRVRGAFRSTAGDEENADDDAGRRRQQPRRAGSQDDSGNESGGDDEADEQTSLLPRRTVRFAHHAKQRVVGFGNSIYQALPRPLQGAVDRAAPFVNSASIGAIIGAIIGLTPALHRIFFNSANEGGYFKAWLTTPLKNTGELFVTLQVVIVGVKLSLSLQRLKQGEESGDVPWRAILFVTLWRFFVMPAISVPLIWAIATNSSVLSSDPILWFAMMVMPVGPPAMRILALADVSHMGEAVKMSIARFLTVLYAFTPLIAFTVAGALRASEAASARNSDA